MKILLIGNRILSEQELASLLKENNLAAYTLSCIHGDMAIELVKKIDIGLVVVHADMDQDLARLTDLLQRFKQEQPGTYVMLLLASDDFCQISEELQEVVDDYLTLPIVGVELAIRARKAGRHAQSHERPVKGAGEGDLLQVNAEKQPPLSSIRAADQLSAATIPSADMVASTTSTERGPDNLDLEREHNPINQAESKKFENESNPISKAESLDGVLGDPLKNPASISEPPTAESEKTLNPESTAEQSGATEADDSNNASGEETGEDWFSNVRTAFTDAGNSDGISRLSKRFISRTAKVAVLGLALLVLGMVGVFLAQGKLPGGVPTDSLNNERNPSRFFSDIRAWFTESGTTPANTFQAGTVNIKASEAMSKGGVNYYSPIQNLKPGDCLIKIITISNDRSERILLRAKITEAWTGTPNGSNDITTVSRDLSNIHWYIENEPWPKADWIFNDGYWYYAGVLGPADGAASPNDSTNKEPLANITFLTRLSVDSPMIDSAYQGATYTINITFEAIPVSVDPGLDQWNYDWASAAALNWDNGTAWTIADLMFQYNDRVYDPVNLEDIQCQQDNLM